MFSGDPIIGIPFFGFMWGCRHCAAPVAFFTTVARFGFERKLIVIPSTYFK